MTSLLDIETVHCSHVIWKMKLNDFLSGESVTGFEVAGQCDLGQWLDGLSPKERASLPNIKKLRKVHDKFHKNSEKLFSVVKKDRHDPNIKKAFRNLDKLSGKILKLLSALEDHLKRKKAL